MAVTLRLFRIGKKHIPMYRIVAIDKRNKRNGKYIEQIGSYNPMSDPYKLSIDKKRFDYWKSKGAEVSEGFEKLLKKQFSKLI